MTVRPAGAADYPAVNDLMVRLIDEIYAREPERVRRALKANFTAAALEKIQAEEQSVLYVAETGGQVAAFLCGWYFRHVFTIYWIYCLREFRGRGAVRGLLERAESDLRAKGCWKFEMYAYAEIDYLLDFSSKLGFTRGPLVEKNMFGFRIQNISKVLAEPDAETRETKIRIVGEAGQGVKLLSHTLAQILAQLGREVSLNLSYDAAVRGGTISADLIYSDRPIANPVIDEADVLVKLTKTLEWNPAKKRVVDKGASREASLSYAFQTGPGALSGFEDVAVSIFGSKIYFNMIALGRILRHIGINILILNIKGLLPDRGIEKNLEAIRYGLSYHDEF